MPKIFKEKCPNVSHTHSARAIARDASFKRAARFVIEAPAGCPSGGHLADRRSRSSLADRR